MYRVNLLPRKVLITPDEVIAAGPTDGQADVRNILQAIQIAEDRFVKQAICKDLYDDFRDQKNTLVTSDNITALTANFPSGTTLTIGSFVNAIELCSTEYQTLWTEQLWKLVAECVVYTATPTNWSRYSPAGELVNNPKSISSDSGSGANSVDLADIKWKMTKLQQDRIDPLIAATQDYLFSNAGSYPNFNCMQIPDCYCNPCVNGINNNPGNGGVSVQRKTAWIHVNRYKRNDHRDHYSRCDDQC